MIMMKGEGEIDREEEEKKKKKHPPPPPPPEPMREKLWKKGNNFSSWHYLHPLFSTFLYDVWISELEFDGRFMNRVNDR